MNSRTLRRFLRCAAVELGRSGATRNAGNWLYRTATERYVAALRRRLEVREAWILGSGADGSGYHPGASDLDFLLVVDDEAPLKPLVEMFERHFFLYPEGTTVEHLVVYSTSEWKVFRPVFDDARTGRGAPLFGTSRRDKVETPVAFRDVFYRVIGTLSALQPSVHRWETGDTLDHWLLDHGKRRIDALLRRLAMLGGCPSPVPFADQPDPRRWLAKVLVALVAMERACPRSSESPRVAEPFTVPSPIPDSPWGLRSSAALSRYRSIDHWLADRWDEDHVRWLLDEYAGTDRKVFVHEPCGFDALHANYPLRPSSFWNFAEARWESRPQRFEPTRTHLEALRHYGRYRLAGIPEANEALRYLVTEGRKDEGKSLRPEAFAQGNARCHLSSQGTSLGPGHSPPPGVSA